MAGSVVSRGQSTALTLRDFLVVAPSGHTTGGVEEESGRRLRMRRDPLDLCLTPPTY
jgi:hypothetical protein